MNTSLPRRADALLYQLVTQLPTSDVDRTDFILRLGSTWPVLYAGVDNLYGSRGGTEVILTELVALLYRKWSERNTELRALDMERISQGAWYAQSGLVAMQLYVDRFAGTIRGVQQRLSYMEELGINTLHLMPILQTPQEHNDGGYAVSDYGTVAPELGSVDDLKALATEMHRRGMVLVLDYVLNHTSDEHKWAQHAKAGDPAYQDYYFMYPDRVIPDQYEQSLPEVFPETAPGNFTWREEIQRWVMTVFHSYQWDLNYANPQVFLEMVSILLDLANNGVDIVRLDAVPYLWKRLGTESRNLPEAHQLVQLFNQCARVAAPGIAFIAEAIVEPREIATYFGEGSAAGRECELAYNASLMVLLWDALATSKTCLLERSLQELPATSGDTGWLNYVRCHDDIGLGYDEHHLWEQGWNPAAHRAYIVKYYTGEFQDSVARGARFMFNPRNGDARISGTAASLAGIEQALELRDPSALSMAIDRITALYGVIFSLGGIPIVYSGDELGVTNDYSYAQEDNLKSDNRWMHRPWLSDELREKRKTEGTYSAIIFQRIARMIALRRTYSALHDVRMPEVIPTRNPHLLAYLRRCGGDEPSVLVLINFSMQPVPVESTLLERVGFSRGTTEPRDILADHPFLPVGEILAPYQCAWVVK